MYGYSSYGTNEYATRRFFRSGPVVKLAMTIVRSTYNLAKTFKNTYGVGPVVRLLFRNSTLEL
jgi:hypothetical protein